MTNRCSLFLISLAFPVLAAAQPPAPPPPPDAPDSGAQITVSGRITHFNYGPDGRVSGMVVDGNNLVALPPDWAMQVELLAKPGETASITGVVAQGDAAPVGSGMRIVQPQSLRVAGKVFTETLPSSPAPYTGSGVIRQLNYGAQGEVNGFVLQDGIIARTPPFGATDISVVKPGARIAFSGFAAATPSGRTVVEVQSITVNGQTIAMNAAPPPPGPARGPRRGSRAVPLPPPPAPPQL